MAIEDEDVLDKMVQPELVGWGRGAGRTGAATSKHQVGNDQGSVCSWIRRRTSRSGSSFGPRYVSSDKRREVDSQLPLQIQLLPSPATSLPSCSPTLQSIHGHTSSVTALLSVFCRPSCSSASLPQLLPSLAASPLPLSTVTVPNPFLFSFLDHVPLSPSYTSLDPIASPSPVSHSSSESRYSFSQLLLSPGGPSVTTLVSTPTELPLPWAKLLLPPRTYYLPQILGSFAPPDTLTDSLSESSCFLHGPLMATQPPTPSWGLVTPIATFSPNHCHPGSNCFSGTSNFSLPGSKYSFLPALFSQLRPI